MNSLLRGILVGILLSISTAVFGQVTASFSYPKPKSETWLVLPCCSHHWRERGVDHNEDNHGIALDYRFPSKHHLLIGGYRNSTDYQSHYGALGAHLHETKVYGLTVETLLSLGLVTGYGDSIAQRQGWKPFALPLVRVHNGQLGFSVIGIPGIMTALAFEWRLP